MKKYFLATVSVLALSTSGQASDLPAKASPYAPVAVPTWTGPYLGIVGGVARHDASFKDLGCAFNCGTFEGNKTGGAIGALAGYNWQSRNFVYGLEGDFSWTTSKASSNGTIASGYSGYTTNKSSKVDALATLRARFGIDMGGTLPYLTVGLAAGQIKNSYTLGYGGGFLSNSKTTWAPGIVVGGGVEHQFANSRWSVKSEILWVGFKDTHFNGLAGYGAGTVTMSNSMTIGRLGLNYRF